jgi:hypothetical protein
VPGEFLLRRLTTSALVAVSASLGFAVPGELRQPSAFSSTGLPDLEIEVEVAVLNETCIPDAILAVSEDGPDETNRASTSLLETIGDRCRTVLRLERGSRWTVRAVGPRCWSESAQLTETGQDSVTLRAWGSSQVRVRFRPGLENRDGSGWSVSLGSAAEDLAKQPVQCEFSRADAVCAIPAEIPFDLRLAHPRYAPIYLWDLLVSREETPRIDAMLVEGASLAGWLHDETGAPIADTAVIVEPDPAWASRMAEFSRDHRREKTSERGFFQITGVEPGVYVIRSRIAGASSGSRTGVRIEEGEETFLQEPIVLRPLVEALVVITPQTDPSGSPWYVTMRRRLSDPRFLHDVAAGPAFLDGRWEAAGLEPGLYSLSVSDHYGRIFRTEDISISEDRRIFEIELGSVAVEGKLTLAGKPIAAEVVFIDRLEGAEVGMTTGEDGTFRGLLPRAGKWEVNIQVSKNRQTIRVGSPVDVSSGGEGRPARVDLELPGARIEGKVTDVQGRPLRAGVMVLREGAQTSATGTSDQDGRFELISVQLGPMFISARTRTGQSDVLPLNLEDGKRYEMDLLIADQRKLRGWVETPEGGALAGAIVRFVIPPLFDMREVVTSPGGRFEVSLPSHVPLVHAIVLMPGFPATIVRVDLDERTYQDAVIRIGRPAGRLVLAMPGTPPWPLIIRDETPISVRHLLFPAGSREWAESFTTEGINLLLSPGHYRVCLQDSGSGWRCESALVAQNGTGYVSLLEIP